jgi:CBS domain-containing protein
LLVSNEGEYMSLESELRNEQVSHLSLSGFTAVPSGTSVRDAMGQMRAERNSVCLITRERSLTGIFTERDVLRKVAGAPDILDDSIDAVMTADPVSIGPDTSAAAALGLMDKHGIRNLPVLDASGEIVGSMTHMAVIEWLAARYPVEVLNRPPEPERFPRKAEGG